MTKTKASLSKRKKKKAAQEHKTKMLHRRAAALKRLSLPVNLNKEKYKNVSKRLY